MTDHDFRRDSRRRCLSLATLVLGLQVTAAVAQEPIDCSLPYTDTRLGKCDVLRRASEFPTCLSRADVPEHSCVLMDADLSFCADQSPVSITAIFDRSNKTLDCRGGVIDHGRGRFGPVAGLPPAPNTVDVPYVRFLDDRSLSDITVRDCTMRGTPHAGIQMIRFFGGELGPDGELDEGDPLPLGHHDILLEDLRLDGGTVGIYLGNFSRDVTLRRVHVNGTRRIAVYSEAGSHRITLEDSVISNNQTREAVAIDSTYDSVIRDTLFVNNREGGINVYRNCGELKGTVCPVVRSTAPNRNRIVGNTFVNNGVAGVQIASRQGRNHTEGWCAALDGRPGQFTDTAIDNVVEDNTFVCNDGTSLVLKDGPNTVRDNRIVARDDCVPLEISTGGLGPEAAHLLDGLKLESNTIDSERPVRLRNVGAGVTFVD